jgi:cytochrome c553
MRPSNFLSWYLIWLGSLLVSLAWSKAETSPPHFAKAHAILEANCFKCHSHAANKSRGGLMMDSAAALAAGSDHGPVVVPGKSAESMLIKVLQHPDPEKVMPPKGEKLSEDQINILKEWIDAGALWPQNTSAETETGHQKRRPGQITAEDRQWWAFQPLQATEFPLVKNTPALKHPIDRFIQHKLEMESVTPAPEATPEVLLRRLSFDLTGLPPRPEEMTAFVQAWQAATDRDTVYEMWVDKLLASPAYGERMARSWLDLVRYADGDGYRADDYRPHAWRYRDYVIRSFNADKSYQRFLQEQLAGDELFPEEPDALIATGYLRHGIYEWNARDVRGQWDTILNDLTDTTGDVFLGLGIQCARCHDHKFDPILQRDYYRLRSVFAPIQPGDTVAAGREEQAAYAERLAAWETQHQALREELRNLEQPYLDIAENEAVGRFPDDIQAMIRKPVAERAPLESQLAALAWRQVEYDWDRVDRKFKGDTKERILSLRRALAEAEQSKPAPLPIAFAATDVGPTAPPVTIPKKASAGEIEPGVLTILDPNPLPAVATAKTTGRRAALAKWLSEPTNPLTARVIVNRLWQHHFHQGLAANASDFGMLGEKPTHPELLDWLAVNFIQEGWSLKKLHRLIVTSAAYRRGSNHAEAAAAMLKDPQNRWLWHRPPHRMDAEQIRDAMLAVSGELQGHHGGPGKTPDTPVRTIYTRFMRNTRDALADVFDAPLWFTSASSRDTTTTPVQSLLLANSAMMRARGKAMAIRLEREHPGNAPAQVAGAYRLAFGREIRPQEMKLAEAFMHAQIRQSDANRLGSGQAQFVPEKVPYRDGQAALIEPEGRQQLFQVENSASMPVAGSFTIEAFVVPRSVASTGALRTIVAKWNGKLTTPGWTLGITGQQSRRKPLTIVLQMVGQQADGTVVEAPIFSDLNVQMNKPYYVAAAVTPATPQTPGSVFFAIKDLSNDDEPLLTATVALSLTGGWKNDLPLTIGARTGENLHSFHGVVDDVRLSNQALGQGQLLYTSESLRESTVGYWRFEAKPDVFADFSNHGHTLIRPTLSAETTGSLSPSQAALADFCHALLNASEFLYVE